MTRPRWTGPIAAALALAALAPAAPAPADTVTLKDGTVYTGLVDKDNTVVSIFDGYKRTVLRDTRIARIDNAAPEQFETFRIDQPLTVHAGEMPPHAIDITPGTWDDKGRRTFEYTFYTRANTPRTVRMLQAINTLGPRTVHVRGVDGYWKANLDTETVGKDVVLGILARIDRSNENERLKAGRFLIQARWYPEALAELEQIGKDFPHLADTVRNVDRIVRELDARRLLAEVDLRRKALQPKEVARLLATFPTRDVPADVLVSVREQIRKDEAQADADRALAAEVTRASEALPSDSRAALRGRLLEVLQGLSEAPDAARGRLDAFGKALADPSVPPEAAFARALSGWVVGPEAAIDDLKAAGALWQARDGMARYLSAGPDGRAPALEALRAIELKDDPDGPVAPIGLPSLTRIARLMPPPVRSASEEAPGRALRLRVRDDVNPTPTEYVILLPPEYHPLRSYPAVVALHDGEGPEAAADWWAREAARRGYVVLAPEYNLPGKAPDYRYTPSEHAAVELALRDALRRFAIDPDRVFLAGSMAGGNMALDFGLGHPDLFAGVASVSGMPAKFAWADKDNARLVPLYVALGDLAPTEKELIFPLFQGLIEKNLDVTYVEYFQRGLEPLPEEVGPILDWMGRRRRDPAPSSMEALTARSCDARFFGLVVREFDPRRTATAELAHPLGENLKPARLSYRARNLANLYDVTISGVRRLDIWIAPQYVDFGKRFEVRVNGKSRAKGQPKPQLDAFLEDLRLRGDRSQVYWLKVSI